MNTLIVRNIEVSKNLLKIDFDCTGQIRKFFAKNQFYAEYNTSIEGTPEAILVIPFLATICPIAWSIGAEVHVQTVDEIFVHSLENIKKVFQKFYPRMKFSGRICVENLVKPPAIAHPRAMTLFSGGVDSIATYLRHQTENPIIVSIHGADIDSVNTEAWSIAMKYIVAFSRRTGSELRVIRSNFRSIPDKLMLSCSFSADIDGDWWTRIMHGLALLGLCAPLTHTDKIGKLYIAASWYEEFQRPWGSHPEIDNKVRWTSTTVTHDGYELSRQEKIEILAQYIMNNDHQLRIRSCLDPSNERANCSRCEKCSRTIIGLELAGIDPNECGFTVETDTFLSIRSKLLRGEWIFDDGEKYVWGDLRKHANHNRSLPHPQATLLVNWLLNVNLNNIKSRQRRRTISMLWKIVAPLLKYTPYELYRILRKTYKVLERPLYRIIF